MAPASAVGAGRRGVATALALADRGCRVTVIDQRATGLARDAGELMRRRYRREVVSRGIRTVEGRIRAITGDGVELDTGRVVAAELVVVARTPRPNRDASRFVPDGVPMSVIGDAKQPRSIMEAIAEAHGAVEELT